MEKHLHRIHVRWRRLIVSLYLSFLIFVGRHYTRRSRIHWIGAHRRPRRPERSLFAVCFLGSIFLLGSEQYILWSIMWGGMLSIFLNLYVVYRFLPRKRAHWLS